MGQVDQDKGQKLWLLYLLLLAHRLWKRVGYGFCLFNIGEALAFLFLHWLLYLLLLVHRLLKRVWYGLFCFNIGELLAFLFLCGGVRENMFILKWPCFIKENYCCQCCSVLYSKYSSFSFFYITLGVSLVNWFLYFNLWFN